MYWQSYLTQQFSLKCFNSFVSINFLSMSSLLYNTSHTPQHKSHSFSPRDVKLEEMLFKCKIKSKFREGKEALRYLVWFSLPVQDHFPKKDIVYACVYVCLHLNIKYMHFFFLWRIYYPTLLKMNIDKRLLHKRESTAIYVVNGCQCKQ